MKSIKILGLAVAMALALTAFVGASSASANWFTSESSTTTWNGSRVGSNHVLTLEGETFSCSKVSFSGETNESVTSAITVTPELATCSWVLSTVNWSMNGCKLRFHPGSPVGEKLIGSVDVTGCTTAMRVSAGNCETEIGNQNGVGTVEYKNSIESGKQVITMVANLNSLTFTRSGGGCYGATGTFYNGKYVGEWKVKGSGFGSPTSVAVESAALPSPTLFVAEEAPVTVAGSKTNLKTFNFETDSLSCSSQTLIASSLTTTAKSLAATPGPLTECTIFHEGVSTSIPNNYVSMGGCSYVFYASGKREIVGANCASEPITITMPGCIFTVGPQSGLASLVNNGSGKLRYVQVSGGTAEFSPLTFTEVGPSCAKEGTFSNGAFQSSFKLTATNSGGKPQGISVE